MGVMEGEVVAAAVEAIKPSTPKKLILQWHITDRCNLRCQHCYQSSYQRTGELDFSQWQGVIQQYKDLLEHLSDQAGFPIKGQINVTGGEPFAHEAFLDLLQLFTQHRESFSFAILSNGSFIDETMAKRLQIFAPRFVQISFEGIQRTHDRIRGENQFHTASVALRNLVKVGIRSLIAFTAQHDNYHEFAEVAKHAQSLQVSEIWAERVLPCGNAKQNQTLNTLETQSFFKSMHRVQQRNLRSWLPSTYVRMHRALQFLVAGGEPYQCSAGNGLLALLPNGDVLPCRRLPIVVGNILNSSLIELYQHAPALENLRQSIPPKACQQCFYVEFCRGGLKCLSYTQTGRLDQPDPNCWVR